MVHFSYAYFFFIFLCSILDAAPLYLKDNLKLAQSGDYVVSKQEKNLTLFHVIENTPQKLLIEEITIPEKSIKANHDWKKWVQGGVIGQTCYVRYQLDPKTGNITDYYFLTNEGWKQASTENHLFSQLLNLPFTPQSEHLRKKRGSISARNPNPYWQPKLVFEGKIIEGENLSPWQTQWPQDGSELAGKTLLIYITDKNSRYPSYFPYWIEAKGKVTRASMHLIDSGKELSSIQSIKF